MKRMIASVIILLVGFIAFARGFESQMFWPTLDKASCESMWTVKKFVGKENVILTPENWNGKGLLNKLNELESRADKIAEAGIGQLLLEVDENTFLMVNFDKNGHIVNFGLWNWE